MISLTIRDEDSVSNEVVHIGHPPATTCDTPTSQTVQEQLPKNLTLNVGHGEALLERADRSSHQMELVLAPVELHRRNVQRRLRETRTTKNCFQFTDPTEVGKRLLDVMELPTTAIDRIDRLSMIRSVLSSDDVSITAPAVPSDPRSVEQIRTEVENVTGFHPERLEIVQDAASGLKAPMNVDATEILSAGTDIERALRQRTAKSISKVEVVRRASRKILATDGKIWKEAFPEVGCVSLVGVSSVPAAHIDLLHAVLTSVAVPVHIHFRCGTGSFLSQRVPQMLDVAEPGTVVFEA